MADAIHQLPTDTIPPTAEEKEMISWLFLDKKDQVRSSVSKVATEFKTVLGLGILFFLLSLPQIDGVLSSFFPFTAHSKLFQTLVKTFVFVIFSWVVMNLSYLWKKK